MPLTSDRATETEDGRLLIRYLLEDLSEGERGRVEERYFASDDLYTKLLVTEDDLIDSYVQGEMAREDRERFERVYGADPRLRKKVEANRELLRLVDEYWSPLAVWRRRLLHPLRRALSPGRNTSLAYVLAGLLLIAVLGGASGWLLFERSRIRAEAERARAQWQEREGEYQRRLAALQQPSPTPAAAPQQTPELVRRDGRGPGAQDAGAEKFPERPTAPGGREAGSVPPPVVALVLPSSGIRTPTANGRTQQSLVIPRGAVLVRLSLNLVATEYAAYTISLREVGGPIFWSQVVPRKSPPSTPDRLTIDLPAAIFQSQDYLMQVTAPAPNGGEEILARRQITAINRNPARARAGGQTRR